MNETPIYKTALGVTIGILLAVAIVYLIVTWYLSGQVSAGDDVSRMFEEIASDLDS